MQRPEGDLFLKSPEISTPRLAMGSGYPKRMEIRSSQIRSLHPSNEASANEASCRVQKRSNTGATVGSLPIAKRFKRCPGDLLLPKRDQYSTKSSQLFDQKGHWMSLHCRDSKKGSGAWIPLVPTSLGLWNFVPWRFLISIGSLVASRLIYR